MPYCQWGHAIRSPVHPHAARLTLILLGLALALPAGAFAATGTAVAPPGVLTRSVRSLRAPRGAAGRADRLRRGRRGQLRLLGGALRRHGPGRRRRQDRRRHRHGRRRLRLHPLGHELVAAGRAERPRRGRRRRLRLSVALSGDTALVGADGKTVGGQTDAGAAYVFTRSGTSWSQQAELTDPDAAASDDFGCSVALSGDTALVGAPGKTVGGQATPAPPTSSARSGTSWSQQAELSASDAAADDWFGCSVALSGDTALVGAYGKTVGGQDTPAPPTSSRARGRAGRSRPS